MNKTKIEWCDMTWNPVTGCLHGCEYCYARKIADRFATASSKQMIEDMLEISEMDGVPPTLEHFYKTKPFEAGFYPTFYHHRLDEPSKAKKPQKIFVCSMSDLFGGWVPEEWIEAVFEACESAPQHKYLFLTKNPNRYIELASSDALPTQHWYGTSITKGNELQEWFYGANFNTFVSFEPVLGEFEAGVDLQGLLDWAIIGAETGNRKGKVIPKREWIENIVTACHKANIPVFMKDSLKDLMGDDFIQEWPDGLRCSNG
jgi:protein gp37